MFRANIVLSIWIFGYVLCISQNSIYWRCNYCLEISNARRTVFEFHSKRPVRNNFHGSESSTIWYVTTIIRSGMNYAYANSLRRYVPLKMIQSRTKKVCKKGKVKEGEYDTENTMELKIIIPCAQTFPDFIDMPYVIQRRNNSSIIKNFSIDICLFLIFIDFVAIS